MSYRSEQVNANLAKGAARAGEVLQLLEFWRRDGEPDPATFMQRAVQQNLLGKDSRKRASDVVRNVFGRRYFPNGSVTPGRYLAQLHESRVSREVVNLILYYHAALAERALYLIASELIFDRHSAGYESIATDDAVNFIEFLSTDGRADVVYSHEMKVKMAQSALTALRDFGILEGRARKRIAPVHVPHQVVAYVVHSLRDEGNSAKRIVEHDDWRLFLLTAHDVENACIEAAQYGHFGYHAAGSVRRFDWKFQSLEEYVDALVEA